MRGEEEDLSVGLALIGKTLSKSKVTLLLLLSSDRGKEGLMTQKVVDT